MNGDDGIRSHVVSRSGKRRRVTTHIEVAHDLTDIGVNAGTRGVIVDMNRHGLYTIRFAGRDINDATLRRGEFTVIKETTHRD